MGKGQSTQQNQTNANRSSGMGHTDKKHSGGSASSEKASNTPKSNDDRKENKK